MNDKAKEILKKALHSTEQAVVDYVNENMAEEGRFEGFAYGFDLPFTENHMKYQFMADALSPEKSRRIAVGVFREGTDRLTSHYVFKGTKAEIIDFLKSEEGKEQIYASVIELSDKTDDYWD